MAFAAPAEAGQDEEPRLIPWTRRHIRASDAHVHPHVLTRVTCALVLSLATTPSLAESGPPHGFEWRTPGALIETTSTGDVTDGGSEVSPARFLFDENPIAADAYDACVRAGLCKPLRRRQPNQHKVAVGMTWEDAKGFCAQRGMHIQTPLHARSIGDTLASRGAAPEPALLAGAPKAMVTGGFRCVVPRSGGDPHQLPALRVRVRANERQTGRVPTGVDAEWIDGIKAALRAARWDVVDDPKQAVQFEIVATVQYSGLKNSLELLLLRAQDKKPLVRTSGGSASAYPRDQLVSNLGDCLLGLRPELCAPRRR